MLSFPLYVSQRLISSVSTAFGAAESQLLGLLFSYIESKGRYGYRTLPKMIL
jgi:hypothetical protein